jgi:hypothetical protein
MAGEISFGLMFLAPGGHFAGLPAEFAHPCCAGGLPDRAADAHRIRAVATQARGAKALVWLFNAS